MYKNMDEKNPENMPVVKISRVNDKAIVNVENNINISKIVYRWNNGVDTAVPIGAPYATENITLPVSDSTLYLTVEDINGRQVNYAKAYQLTGADLTKPTINIETENGSSQMTITIDDNTAIKCFTYQWDNEEPVTIEAEEENQTHLTRSIELTPGTKNITITAEDKSGNIETLVKPIIITTATPVVTIQLVGDGKEFYITVTDPDGIKDITFNINGETFKVENYNKTEAQTRTLSFKEGNNTISVEVTNMSGYTSIQTKELQYPFPQ